MAVTDSVYYFLGILLLSVNKIRHASQGYRTPRPFPMAQYDKAIEYDLRTVENWIQFCGQYTGAPFTLKDRVILELGPGADLGTGLISLSKGAKEYHSIDVHDLVKSAPKEFYMSLLSKIIAAKEPVVSTDVLRSELETARLGNGRLNFACRNDFDLSIFSDKGIDLVVSQAAFEHFDDVNMTICQLSRVVKSGAILIAEIDLKTHTRWIKDFDPLNIYRYSKQLYERFKFRGLPNRIRPFEYRDFLEKNGWIDVQIIPVSVLEEHRLARVEGALDERFRDSRNQMQYLSVMVCATKG